MFLVRKLLLVIMVLVLEAFSRSVTSNIKWRFSITHHKITSPGQSSAADNSLKKGWYRMSLGHGTMPTYEPDQYYGGR